LLVIANCKSSEAISGFYRTYVKSNLTAENAENAENAEETYILGGRRESCKSGKGGLTTEDTEVHGEKPETLGDKLGLMP
jgi:hypothetical protein